MLAVTRKTGESIIIGDNIEIKVVEIQKGQVRIGIEAPKEVSIVRKEIIDEVKDTNKMSNVSSGSINLDELANKVKASQKV